MGEEIGEDALARFAELWPQLEREFAALAPAEPAPATADVAEPSSAGAPVTAGTGDGGRPPSDAGVAPGSSWRCVPS